MMGGRQSRFLGATALAGALWQVQLIEDQHHAAAAVAPKQQAHVAEKEEAAQAKEATATAWERQLRELAASGSFVDVAARAARAT